ncbi:MAG: NirD/YgiW/YdeI family stress tolerance protein [Rickettsiales bacterium]|nr:NirD/YgiW/YdeI family stress tolerance protein [Rickettsiales bacterium]
MKKLLVLSGFLAIFAGAANAEFTDVNGGRGGFTGAKDVIVSVAQAKEMRDDTRVVLQGNIVSQTKHEKYLFQDATGAITIEIDDDDWRGVNVGPKDTIKIIGEVDKGLFNTEIDVEYISKI